MTPFDLDCRDADFRGRPEPTGKSAAARMLVVQYGVAAAFIASEIESVDSDLAALIRLELARASNSRSSECQHQ